MVNLGRVVPTQIYLNFTLLDFSGKHYLGLIGIFVVIVEVGVLVSSTTSLACPSVCAMEMLYVQAESPSASATILIILYIISSYFFWVSLDE